MTNPIRHALVIGVGRAFGASAAARLRADGATVFDDMAALPADIALDALIMDVSDVVPEMPFREVNEDHLRAALDGQLYPLVAAVQAAVPFMTDGGAIILVVSKAYLGAWGGVQVAASAAACVAMARSMAIELAPRGIRVNSVATGTGSVPVDVAATVAWLASGDSASVTGETLLADRGASLQMAQAARR